MLNAISDGRRQHAATTFFPQAFTFFEIAPEVFAAFAHTGSTELLGHFGSLNGSRATRKNHSSIQRTRRIRFEQLEPRNMLTAVTGDYDSSGLVDGGDYNTWRASFGEAGEVAADGNRNFVVDAADYVVWRKNLGKSLSDVPPNPPLGVGAVVTGPTSVQITWQAVTGATSYDVQRRRPNVANDPFITMGNDVTGTSFTDTTVVSGTVYEYQLIAQNTAGSSQPSQTATVTAGESNITAYRAQHLHDPENPTNSPIYFPFQRTAVAEADEESLTVGPGIRINRDDDNDNDIVDRFEGGHSNPVGK